MVKGWQLFVIMQIAVVICFVIWIFLSFPVWSKALLEMVALGATLVALELGYFGWMLAVGAAMNARLPPGLRRGIVLPSIGLSVAVVYVSFSSFWFTDQMFKGTFSPIFITLHFLSMFVNFYLVWFLSRSLVAAEEHSKPSLDRVLGIFFALWLTMFFPIAAWWVQNRARRVAGVESA
ncbi:MAG: hypothetical protein Q8S00_23660 [Deltaproteobacteria bacterium]|nr:hypothetical protein [Deltaproteobacteria bacterium]MDZ4343330.1 hypothetical protein [Candidatus Binatia bacterium]